MIGYRSIIASGMRWRHNQGGIFPLSPVPKLSGFDVSHAREILQSQRAFFIRWETEFDQCSDTEWWHIIKDVPTAIDRLPKKTRYMIRKAAGKFYSKQVNRDDIIKEGHSIYSRAYERYNTHEPMFGCERFIVAIKKLPLATEFWAVYDSATDRMLGFSENYVEDSTCFFVTMWIDPAALKDFAGYLLFYDMEQHYLIDRNFKYLSDGARSISHDTEIHDFLIKKFLFRKAYARLHVVYKPWLAFLVFLSYPFRNIINYLDLPGLAGVKILLRQESIRRCCSKGAL